MASIVIDPGHAPGNPNHGPTGYYEYAGMWKLANFLKTALVRSNCTVEFTRTEKQDVSLGERGRKSKGAVLFLSLHSDASNGKARGVTGFYSIRMKQDKAFVADMTKATAKVMGTSDRGAKYKQSTVSNGYDYYTVIFAAEATDCDHVMLIENGFHDNPLDEAVLKQDSKLEAMAEAQAQVICKYLGVKYVPKPAPAKPLPLDKQFPEGTKIKILTGAVWAENGKPVPSYIRIKTCYVRGIKGNAVKVSWLKSGAISGTVLPKYLKKV